MTEEIPKPLEREPQQIAKPLPKSKFRTYWSATAGKIRSFWIESKRVLKVTKKPGKEEFKMIVTVSGLGLAVVGLIGFLIHVAKELLF